MGLRAKLLLPLIIGYAFFALFVHFYWHPEKSQIEFLLLVIFVFIIITGLFLHNYIINKPLQYAKKAAIRFADGDYETPLINSGNDELTNILDQLRLQLKESHTDLNQALTIAQYHEAKQRAVISTMGDAVITINDLGLIESFNPSAERIFGYGAADVLGENVNLLMPELHFSNDDDHNDTNVEHFFGKSKELQGKHINEKLIDIEITLSEFQLDDQNTFTAIVRDISERKLQQTQLEEKTKLLEQAKNDAVDASKAKSDFLASMTHEIRTPMNGVLGMTQLLSETQLESDQLEYLQIIENSGSALLKIIDDILDFSKIEAHKMTLEPIAFDLEQTAFEVTRLISLKAEEKGIELLLSYSPNCPKYLIGDAGRIRQIITNLVSNAVKFTANGYVLVKIKSEEQTDQYAQLNISIEDTGIGISKEAQNNLFESFSQADNSTTRRFGGTGLGLAISKRLTHLMDGDIGVDSVPDEGSTFWFKIKLAIAENPEPLNEAQLTNVNALVIDSNTTNLRILSEQLENLGINISSATSSKETLSILNESLNTDGSIEFVIMSQLMSDTDGEGLGRTIKSDPNLAGIPLILLTSSGQRGDAKRFSDAGFDAYLSTPINQNTLQQTLERILASKQQNKTHDLITRHNIIDVQQEESLFQGRVLLAEDDLTNQKVATVFLEKYGLIVDVANNGVEAVELVKNNFYNLILMDCRMPEMDGYEATQQIRALDQGRHMPMIALTANVSKADQDKCYAAGMDDFLGKPFKREKLKNKLLHWLKQGNDPIKKKEKNKEKQAQNKQTLKDVPGNTISNPINMEVFESLQSALGKHYDELVPGFINQNNKRIEFLKNNYSDNDLKEIEIHAHSLKSSSAIIGAEVLSELCKELERQAAENNTDGIIELINNVCSEYEKVRDVLITII